MKPRSNPVRRAGTFCLAAAACLVLAVPGLAPADYIITNFDAPGAAQGAFAFGLSDAGQIVGYFRDGANVNHGFLRDTAGGITVLDYPGAGATSASGITGSGQIFGSYSAFNGAPIHGFRLSGGAYSPLDVPGSTQTTIEGASPSGLVVGTYNGPGEYGFLLSGGTYTKLTIPGTGYISPNGVNDSGQVVGYYDGGPGNAAFLYSGGNYTTLLFNGRSTVASGINGSGEIVGYYAGVGHEPSNRGFLYDAGSGFQTFDVPGAGKNGTVPFGINDKGGITGYYFDDNGMAHGFLATPTPEPSSLALFGAGMAALAGWRALRHLRGKLPGL